MIVLWDEDDPLLPLEVFPTPTIPLPEAAALIPYRSAEFYGTEDLLKGDKRKGGKRKMEETKRKELTQLLNELTKESQAELLVLLKRYLLLKHNSPVYKNSANKGALAYAFLSKHFKPAFKS